MYSVDERRGLTRSEGRRAPSGGKDETARCIYMYMYTHTHMYVYMCL